MQPTWKHVPILSFAMLLCTLILSLVQSPVVQASPALAPLAVSNPNATVFINEFHYDNAGTDTGEFIEIAGPAGTDLTGWSVVLYNGANGTSYNTTPVPSIPNTGCAYGFVTLTYPQDGIQNGSPDAIALVDNTNTVVQFLSYEGSFSATNGVANGLATTAITPTEVGTTPIGSSLRLTGSGTTYSNFTWQSPAPATPGAANTGQTFGSGDVAPCVTSYAPANNSADISLNANLSVNFSENVTATTPWFTIVCSLSGAHTATVSGGPQTFTLDPDMDFASNESCTVTLSASQIVDQDGTPQPMNADVAWTFKTLLVYGTCGDNTETPIHTVQGSGLASLDVNTAVIIEGVVVGDYQGTTALSGFYLQEEDAEADADAATSEGIFVFSNTEVNAGDVVRVQGTVTEFGDAGVTLTEITNVTQLGVCSTGASVTPTTVDMPVSSLDEWERVEGMLVIIPEQLTVTENFTLARFGELHLSANGRLYQATHLVAPGAPAQAQLAANNLNRIVLDDASTVQNPLSVIYPSPELSANNTLRTGYTVENVTGVIDQRFDLYRIQPIGTPTFVAANPRTTAPEEVGGTLKVASANVLNYFTTLDRGGNAEDCGPEGNKQECRGADTAEEFTRQRTKTLNALAAINADVVGLIELENNPTASLDDLVAGLNALPGVGPYAYINTGYIGTDAIKVALIYKPATVTPVGTYAILDSTIDPTFIDTANRPVLAQTFQENATTERFTVAVNHLKSKGSACDGDPDTGDGQGNCNLTRTAAATALVNWIASDPTGVGDPDYLIIGDLNSYAMEDPITAIKAAGYTDLLAYYHGQAAYSYVFEGQSGYLDHALASSTLLNQVTGAGDWHVSTDEPVALDYNVEFKSPAQVASFYTPEPYRFSDHDPLVVGLDLQSESSITIVKESRPDNRRNFRFTGDLGNFRLDDAGGDDNDNTQSSLTFDVEAGSYTIVEDVPHSWHLTSIACVGGDSTVDLANHNVTIHLVAGQNITCTFTNEYGSAIWIEKYLDRNANGSRASEAGLKGWEMKLYNSAGVVVATDTTNGAGKVHFWDIAPGQYTLCETQQSGWFNSQPGTLDPTYNQPCYALTLGPAELWLVQFGNHRNAQASTSQVATPNAPNMTPLEVEDVDDESYEDDGTFVDPTLNTPAQGEGQPLFMPHITR